MKLRTWVGGAVLIGLTVGLGRWWLVAGEADEAQWFANRIWAERMPRDDRDMVLYLTPLKVGSKQFGAIQRQSRYRIVADRFEWTRSGSTLKLGFPQERRRAELKVRSWSCKGEAPAPFDLCLELSSGKETLTLYSRRHWVVPREGEAPLEIPADGDVLPLDDGACADCAPGLPAVLSELGL